MCVVHMCALCVVYLSLCVSPNVVCNSACASLCGCGLYLCACVLYLCVCMSVCCVFTESTYAPDLPLHSFLALPIRHLWWLSSLRDGHPLCPQQLSWASVVAHLSFSAWWLIQLGRTLGLSSPPTSCYLVQHISFLLTNVTWWAQGLLHFLFPSQFLVEGWVLELLGKFLNFGVWWSQTWQNYSLEILALLLMSPEYMLLRVVCPQFV